MSYDPDKFNYFKDFNFSFFFFSNGHFTELINISYRRFYQICRKYLMSDGRLFSPLSRCSESFLWQVLFSLR